MTHGESMLEGAGARYLEISPFVKSYLGQASKEIYYDASGDPHPYFVDFRVTLTNEEEVDIEMKPHGKFRDPAIKEKYARIAVRYQEMGRRFRVMTDLDVSFEPLFTTLKILNYHRVGKAPIHHLGKHARKLSTSAFSTVGEAAELIGSVADVYRQIASGFLSMDFQQPLSPASSVWIRREGDGNDSLRV